MLKSKGWIVIIMKFMVLGLMAAQPFGQAFMERHGSDNDPPRHIARKLKRDAARIAIRVESKGRHIAQQSVEVPTQQAALYYKLLVSVYNSQLPEAEAVSKCGIHASSDIPIDRFWVVYEKGVPWAAPLREGKHEVDGEMGDLLDDFDLEVTDCKNWDAKHGIITVQSAKLYNMAALAHRFRGIEGVSDIRTKNTASIGTGSDHDVEVSSGTGHWVVKYTRKWSNFKDGKKHEWVFAVDESSGKVRLLKETGDEVPLWMGCTASR